MKYSDMGNGVMLSLVKLLVNNLNLNKTNVYLIVS